jgi:hypothetical protein
MINSPNISTLVVELMVRKEVIMTLEYYLYGSLLLLIGFIAGLVAVPFLHWIMVGRNNGKIK